MKTFPSSLLKSPVRLSLLLIIVCSLYFQAHEKWCRPTWLMINGDGRGYYAYLPAIFIYHDLQYKFIEGTEKKYQTSHINILDHVEDKKFDKYFCGEAILLFPFFLLACFLSFLLGFEVDGYSFIFQCVPAVAGLFYLICGFLFLRKVLSYYCNEQISAFIILSIFFGTNLLYYTWNEPSMSHVFSFSLISAFIYFIKTFFAEMRKRDLLFSTLFYALIILVRPSNAVIILIVPFLAGNFECMTELFRFVFQDIKLLIKIVTLFFLLISLQLLLYYLQTGHWFILGYSNEHFDFTKPEIFNVLFSYRKGFLIYTPLAFISLFGLFVLLKKDRFLFFSVLIFLLIDLWVISSWWTWTYGASFSQRPLIDHLSVFALLLAILLNAIKNKIAKGTLIISISFCILLNLFQTWQYWQQIIPYDGMTKERYWSFFFKTDNRYLGIYSPNITIPEEISGENVAVFKNDIESASYGFDRNSISKENAHSGEYSSKISDEINRGISFSKKIKDVFPTVDSNSFVQVKLWAWIASFESDAQLVISFEHGGRSYNWNTFKVTDQAIGEKKWFSCVMNSMIPKPQGDDDIVSVYVLKSDKSVVFTDDYEISFLKKITKQK